MLVGVNPGIVLISLMTTFWSSSRKKSTRARPSPSIASKAVSAFARTSAAMCSGRSAYTESWVYSSPSGRYLVSKS